jgi:hypothetical protein
MPMGAVISLGVLVLASPGQAQDIGSDCDVTSFRIWSSESFGPGQRVTWFGNPVLQCPDGTRIQADSAVVYESMVAASSSDE